MSTERRSLGIVAAVALAAVALSACGGSSNTKAGAPAAGRLDPATRVSAGVIAYADVTVKYQGSLRSNLVDSIDKLAGPGAAKQLVASLTKGSGNGSSLNDLKDIAGGHIGVALTAIPQSTGDAAITDDLLAVVPTASPSAAKRFIAANPADQGTTTRVVGDFAIESGSAAAGAIVTSAKGSLADDPSYTASVAQLGSSDQVATVFIRAKKLYQALIPVLDSRNAATGQVLSQQTAKLKPSSSFVLGLGAGANSFRLDLAQHDIPSTGSTATDPGDVSSLPGDSWLAMSLNFDSQLVKQLTAMLPATLAQEQAVAGNNAAGEAEALERDVISALGPITLSVAGSSIGGAQAGLTLTPLDSAAGANLLSVLQQALKRAPVLTTKVGKQIIVSFGYADPKDLLSPSTHLSGNATFKTAVAQLPQGSHVPVFIDLNELATFFAPLASDASDAQVWRVMHKLTYLIEGSSGTHATLLLGLK